jgi:hypothetical protein
MCWSGGAGRWAWRARWERRCGASRGNSRKRPFDALEQKAFELAQNPMANPKDVKAIFTLVLKARDQEQDKASHRLDREKFAVSTCELFLKWYAEARAREIAESGLSNAEKIARLRENYFADVDALEAAGTVKLPE